MLSTRKIAEEYLDGKIDVCDLLNDPDFLADVDNSILNLIKEKDSWGDLTVARKRKKLIDKIEKAYSKG